MKVKVTVMCDVHWLDEADIPTPELRPDDPRKQEILEFIESAVFQAICQDENESLVGGQSDWPAEIVILPDYTKAEILQ